jgi:hypothetical protein
MFRSILLIALLVLLPACAGFDTQQQKIAVTCESIASSADALAAARTADRLTQAQQDTAVRLVRMTVPFCQPPADSLDSVKMAALTSAAAELAALAGSTK